MDTSHGLVDHARKRPRVSERTHSRDVDTDHDQNVIEDADSAPTDDNVAGSVVVRYPVIHVGRSTGGDVAEVCDFNDEIMSSGEENESRMRARMRGRANMILNIKVQKALVVYTKRLVQHQWKKLPRRLGFEGAAIEGGCAIRVDGLPRFWWYS